MNRYAVTLRHDAGRVRLVTAAPDRAAAVRTILAAELAPARAVVEVTELGPVVTQ